MPNFSNMKLGRKSGISNARVPNLFRHMHMVMPSPAVSWVAKVPSFPVLMNDQIGDCTAAGCLHQLQVWLNNNGKFYIPNDSDAVDLYSATSAYPAQDDGAVEQTVLKYWQNTGIQTPFSNDKILYAALNPHDINQLKLSIEYFGGVYLGISMPITVQMQTVWDVTAGGLTGDGAPGSWGGHCVMCPAYDQQVFTAASWGQLIPVTYAFMQAYCEEAYALVSQDWLSMQGISPPGFNWNTLMTDLQAITSD
jgi:hypothetical protein